MDNKHLEAGLEHVDQEFVTVQGNTVTFQIADPDKNIPGCKDRDIVKFATGMYTSVNSDTRFGEGPKCVSSLLTSIYWIKALMHVVRNGPEARHPRVLPKRER